MQRCWHTLQLNKSGSLVDISHNCPLCYWRLCCMCILSLSKSPEVFVLSGVMVLVHVYTNLVRAPPVHQVVLPIGESQRKWYKSQLKQSSPRTTYLQRSSSHVKARWGLGQPPAMNLPSIQELHTIELRLPVTC